MEEGGGAQPDPTPVKVFGLLGALVFILEGVAVPVSPFAHLLLLYTFYWLARFYRDRQVFRLAAAWTATAIPASLYTAAATRLTPFTLFFFPFSPATLASIAAAWTATAVPFFLLMRRLWRHSGMWEFRLAALAYLLGSPLIALKAGIFTIIFAFVVLTTAFARWTPPP